METRYPRLREMLKACIAVPTDPANQLQADMVTKLIPSLVDQITDFELERLITDIVEEQHGTYYS